MNSKTTSVKLAILGVLIVAAACAPFIACSSTDPTPTPVPPTAVPPTETPIPPTPTPVSPTQTPVPPTPTPVPPTRTPLPPTATAEPIDEISLIGLSTKNSSCVAEHADKETADTILVTVGLINSHGDVQPEHILHLLGVADTLITCGLIPAMFAPVVAQISPEDAACVVEQSGVEQLLAFFTLTEEQKTQTLNMTALSPLLGALEACGVMVDLTALQ